MGFRSLTEGVDTTPSGALAFHLSGALGQFERDLIRERTNAGFKAAEARGRKRVVTPDKLTRALRISSPAFARRWADGGA